MFGKYFYPLFIVAVTFFNIHVIARPTEEDTKKLTLDIPKEILNSTNLRVPTRWEKGVELLGQIMDAIRFGTGRIVNFGMMARNEIANRAEEFTSEAANAILSLIAARDARQYIQKTSAKQNAIQQQRKRSTFEISTLTPAQSDSFNVLSPILHRETARLESEAQQGLFEFKKPNPLPSLLTNFSTPVPIVDRTKEEDKYGNVGGGGKLIVQGIEGLSSFITNLVDVPGNAVQQFSQGINKVLNRVGAKLNGYQ